MRYQRIKLFPNFNFMMITQSAQMLVPRLPAQSPTSVTDSTRLPSFPNTFGGNSSATLLTIGVN